MPAVRNVHRRTVAAPIGQVGPLLDTLGGPADRWWPRRWPPMRLDPGLDVGARGGHGPIRYVVTAHHPGRLAEFTFTAPRGLHGTHTFRLVPVDAGTTLLEHRIEARTSASVRLGWPLVLRPLHDALMEDCLDRVEREVGSGPARAARWTPWVRLLRAVTRRLA